LSADSYANEMSWREDNLRVSNGEQYLMVVGAAPAHSLSRQRKWYWQRAAVVLPRSTGA
jgi:hypothetical protein